MFTGTPVPGHESVALGLANTCVPDAELEETVKAIAASIVANSWHTVRADKQLVNEGQQFSLSEALAYERRTSPGAGPDMAERLKAFGTRQ
jgi:enoyl-CoA hydratase/carnithine racemase